MALPVSFERRTAVLPTLASMAPPARGAVLDDSVVVSTTRVPALLRMPPPEPAAPVAALDEIVEPVTVRAPPSL